MLKCSPTPVPLVSTVRYLFHQNLTENGWEVVRARCAPDILASTTRLTSKNVIVHDVILSLPLTGRYYSYLLHVVASNHCYEHPYRTSYTELYCTRFVPRPWFECVDLLDSLWRHCTVGWWFWCRHAKESASSIGIPIRPTVHIRLSGLMQAETHWYCTALVTVFSLCVWMYLPI